MPILFAYNVRADMPEEVVYKMLSAFYQNRAKLAAIDSGFSALAKDFMGMQVGRHQRQPGRSGACRACQAPEGAQGLERQVEGRRQRQLIVAT